LQVTIARFSVLIVEDDPAMRSVLRTILSAEGYSVIEAADGANAWNTAQNSPSINVIVLDLGLPDMDGVKLIGRFRRLDSNPPVIVLSSEGQERRKVDAFDLGADDYVTKPFSTEEFLARIRAALRRSAQAGENRPLLHFNGIILDSAKRLVTREGKEVKLSPKEFDLLHLLMSHAGKVLTHRFILDQLWPAETNVQYIRIYIRTLRQKLEDVPDRPTYILTEQGVGYYLGLPENLTRYKNQNIQRNSRERGNCRFAMPKA
jgi:two-component system KDP operon response regulator KdpE